MDKVDTTFGGIAMPLSRMEVPSGSASDVVHLPGACSAAPFFERGFASSPSKRNAQECAYNICATEDPSMSVIQERSTHAGVIASALKDGVGIDVDDTIRHSWERCVGRYALDPERPKKPMMVERQDLISRRERMGSLLQIARIEMLLLSRQMRQAAYGMILTDPDGVILSYLGDAEFSDAAKRTGFREGAIWSEPELGTNGVGTCLVTQRSLIIHREAHFLTQNIGLSCTASPIFDARGKLIAALDISGLYHEPQMHALALVEIAAQNIENRYLLDACRQHYVLRFHSCMEFVCTPGEGVLAFDERGVVQGANRAALDLLGYHEHASLIDHSILEVLDVPLSQLMRLAQRPSGRPELVTGHGQLRFFAAVQAPQLDAHRVKVMAAALEVAEPDDALAALRTCDPAMSMNLKVVRRVLDRDISILLLGETGTGKGYLAKAIHQSSRRSEQLFVQVNCAAIPEMLIESELFGYKPGAFTGAARQGHPGRILQANGGTLFLDEIGDMPLALQARLLTVIEEREVVPLGSGKPIPVDIRIISATHHDPIDLIARGQFRDDLYYRLNGITLTMPALRTRRDLADLVRSLLREEARDRPVQIDEALVQRLARYAWPGNLRQLRNVLRTLLAMAESDYLTSADFDESWLPSSHLVPGARSMASTPVAEERELEADLDEEDLDDDVLAAAECEALRRTLDACHWNVSYAATKLNVSRKTLYRKMHRHGLTRQSGADLQTPCSGRCPS